VERPGGSSEATPETLAAKMSRNRRGVRFDRPPGLSAPRLSTITVLTHADYLIIIAEP